MSDNGHNPATELPPDIIADDATLEVHAIAKDSEAIIELRASELDPDAGGSTQPDVDVWTPQDTIEPPENLPLLANLTKYSQKRADCIGVITRNTVGLGWDVGVWPEHEGQIDRKLIRECRHKLDALARRDKRLDGGRPSFADLMYAVKHDIEEFGNGRMEVSRNRRTGMIDGLYHVPGHRVRRKKDRSGWVMGQNPELVDDASRIDYYNFGEKVEYDADGRPQGKLADGATRWKTNEIIAFQHYTSESRDYGLPRDIGLVGEYAAYKAVIEWTGSFFNNSGVPPTVLFVQGQEQRDGNRVRFRVDASMVRRIKQALASDAPTGKEVVVVPVPPGTNVNAVKLSQLSDRDLTFGNFKGEHKSNVGEAFGLTPIFYNPGGNEGGRYTAEVERALCLEETFDPDQDYLERKLWTTVLPDLGYSELRIIFKRLAVESDSARREAVQNGATIGAVTYGEWRQANGLDPLPYDGDPNDPENPNNQLIRVAGANTTGDPHAPQEFDAADGRGKRPGIGGRPGPRDEVVAKAHDHEGEPHVEAVVDELTGELSEYGPPSADGGS